MFSQTMMIAKNNPAGPPPAQPNLISAYAITSTPIGCGVSWVLEVGWVLDFTNDAAFEIQIRRLGSLIVTGLLTSSSPYYHNTGETGDSGATGVNHSAQYTVELVRKSDSMVVDSAISNTVTVVTGPAC